MVFPCVFTITVFGGRDPICIADTLCVRHHYRVELLRKLCSLLSERTKRDTGLSNTIYRCRLFRSHGFIRMDMGTVGLFEYCDGDSESMLPLDAAEGSGALEI